MLEDNPKIIDDYHRQRSKFERFALKLQDELASLMRSEGINVADTRVRVKSGESLKRKLEAKPKYRSLQDLTDIVGVRIITYYLDDAERAAKVIRGNGQMFSIDWANSENKSDRLRTEQFGYRSDHYILEFGRDYTQLPTYKEFAGLKAEVQVRSILQHAWAEIEHDDLGYHNKNAVPAEIRRGLARVAGLLEVADREFRDIRKLASDLQNLPLPSLRVEGFCEYLAPFEITVARDKVITGGGDLIVRFNTNLTARYGPEKPIQVVIDDGISSNPVRGRLSSATGVTFPDALPMFVGADLKYLRFKLSGVRLNANQIGLSGTKPTIITCALAAKVSDSESSPKVFATKELAVNKIGLCVKFEQVTDFRDRTNCNTDLAMGRIERVILGEVEGVMRIRLTEGFPGAFRDRDRETGTERVPCNHGVRFIAQFSGVRNAQQIWVSTTSTVNGIKLALTQTDSNGANAFVPVDAGPNLILPNGQVIGLVQVGLFNGAGLAVWEVVDAPESDQVSSVELLVIPCWWSNENCPMNAFNAGITVSLAPLSTIGTASDTAPIPRFGPSPGPFQPWGPTESLDQKKSDS